MVDYLTKQMPVLANKKETIMDGMNEFKKELGVKWIKATSGNTYLCPVDALNRIENPKEEHLKMICVEESHNPQND
jgi:hypothetical protein